MKIDLRASNLVFNKYPPVEFVESDDGNNENHLFSINSLEVRFSSLHQALKFEVFCTGAYFNVNHLPFPTPNPINI